ncbi:condensation domain-containing protein [Kitasatospora sp. MAP5-34]|uniref:condensation domain-containing protein n=1 Tax=Kitasatospora sp. MAP5-34 TaxID=3035102 RepID=UPI002473D031|nr:condensation domain-containing protein [Kitasatospora sp. MAP5-34]MDH6578574.1 hypothetical protein [Kitasatospora sp. MAP5-34]
MRSITRGGPLTLAQKRMWLRSYWRGHGEFFPAWTRRWELPPGIPVAAALDAWSTLTARHEILRTVFLIGPDSEPAQVVLAADGFRPPVSVDDAEQPGEDRPAEMAGPLTVGAAFARPLWAARLLATDGQVRSVDLVFDHIVSDGSGLHNWHEQFLDLCQGRDAPLPAVQPLDRQATEPDPQPGTDHAARSPQIPAPGHGRPVTGPRYLLSSTTYEGLLPAVDELCERTSASRAMVFMFAVAWLLNRYSGHPRALFANYVSHRLGRDHGIECQMRPVDVPVEIDDSLSFEQALRSVNAGTLRAYQRDLRSGPVPPEDRARTAAARGVGFVVPVYFNFQGHPRADGPVREPLGKAVVTRREDEWDELGRPWCVVVYVYVQGSQVVLDLDMDVRMLSEETTHAFADLLPGLLQLMAEQPSAPVRTADPLLPPGFAAEANCRLVGDNWVNPDATREVLESARGVRKAEVRCESGEVLAHLALEPGTELFDVHEHLSAALRLHLDVTAPQRYLPLPGPAGTSWWPPGTDADGWRPDQALPSLPPATEAERALCSAIQETHGLAVENLAPTYVAAGGRVLLAPAVTEALRRRRLAGLRSYHFNTPYTLRAIARCLRPEPARDTDGATYLG